MKKYLISNTIDFITNSFNFCYSCDAKDLAELKEKFEINFGKIKTEEENRGYLSFINEKGYRYYIKEI